MKIEKCEQVFNYDFLIINYNDSNILEILKEFLKDTNSNISKFEKGLDTVLKIGSVFDETTFNDIFENNILVKIPIIYYPEAKHSSYKYNIEIYEEIDDFLGEYEIVK